MRAVVDANVWIRAVITPGSPQDRLLEALMEKRFISVCSEPMLSELRAVFLRPEIARASAMTPADVAATITYLRGTSEMVTVTGAYSFCRDPDDNKVIETAIRGRAPVIVSQDSDLSDPALKEPLAKLGVRVLTAVEFLQLLP